MYGRRCREKTSGTLLRRNRPSVQKIEERNQMALAALDDELGLTTLSAEIEDEEAKDRAVYDE
jgi:hypothetical protein